MLKIPAFWAMATVSFYFCGHIGTQKSWSLVLFLLGLTCVGTALFFSEVEEAKKYRR